MWNLKEVLQMNLFTKWKPEIENKFMFTKGERGEG